MPEKHNAERWERYVKAVEQLGNASAPVRMGGVYTLIGLADEWLLDENLDYAERVREGQVIINNLCAYLRSPFPLIREQYTIENRALKEKNTENHSNSFPINKTKIQEEQEVRRTIFTEISKRVSAFDKFDGNKIVHGTWSNFEFNFVKSDIFTIFLIVVPPFCIKKYLVSIWLQGMTIHQLLNSSFYLGIVIPKYSYTQIKYKL